MRNGDRMCGLEWFFGKYKYCTYEARTSIASSSGQALQKGSRVQSLWKTVLDVLGGA